MLFDIFNKKEEFIEPMENKIDETEAKDELAMGCACEPCEASSDCSSTVTFTFTTCIKGPAPDPNTNVPIEAVDNNLRCVTERCQAMVQVPDPCNPNDPTKRIPCKVCLNRFRYVGCINFLANIPRKDKTVSACFSGCQLIDKIRCYSCADDCKTCPPAGGFIVSGPSAKVISSVSVGNDIFAVTVEVTLTLTSPCTP
ncbi:MAG: hypothetical protein AB2417_18180 [Clostridiaceae bacterium]